MSEYSTGTVNVTNASTTVVGVGTLFSTNVTAGDLFTIVASGIAYEIGSVTDDTHLELTGAYAGTTATGQSYAISTSFTSPDSIPYPEQGDTEPTTILKRSMAVIQGLFTKLAPTFTTGDARKQYQVNSGETAVELVHQGAANNVTIDFASDADLTLSAAQNTYSVYTITDTGVVLTTGRNVIVSTDERFITVTNSTAQTLTVKTSAGTGIDVLAGYTIELYCDGANVVSETNLLLNDIQTSAPSVGDIFQFNGANIVVQQLINRENFIIGGDLATNGTNPYQRGTGGTASNGSYMADQWKTVDTIAFSTEPTWAQSTDGLTYTSNEATTHSGYATHTQIKEGYEVTRLFALSDYFVLQGKIKHGTLSGTVYVALRSSGLDYSYVFPVALVGGSATSFTEVIPVPVSGTFGTGTNAGMSIDFVRSNNDATYQTATFNAWQVGNYLSGSDQLDFHATNAATLAFDKIKIEPGSITTPFWTPDVGEELRRCQRYYHEGLTRTQMPGNGSATGIRNQVYFPVTMRATPTVDLTGISAISVTGIGTVSNTTDASSFTISATADATTNTVGWSGTYIVSAEL